MADNAASTLRKAAFKGEINKLKDLNANGNVDVNLGNYDARTALHVAASTGNLKAVECLVEDLEADINVEDRFGGTPLDDALRNNRKDVAKYLTDKGACVGKTSFPGDDSGILCDAASKADLGLLRVLAKRGVDINLGDYDGRTAVHLAASEGKLKVVKCLVDELNANPNVHDRWSGTPLDDALRSGNNNVFKYLKSKGGKSGKVTTVTAVDATALCDAAASGNTDRLTELVVKKGLDVNMADYDDRTALHLAVSEGLMLAVTYLIEELNANVNVKDRYGGTPLDDATRSGHPGIVEYLVGRGALRGKTAIYMDSASLLVDAAGKGDAVALKALQLTGIDVNAVNPDKRTALHISAAEGHLECVKYLINNMKAEVNPQDRWTGTPLDDAEFMGHTAVADFLKGKGGFTSKKADVEEVVVVEEEEEVSEEVKDVRKDANAGGGCVVS